MFSTQSPLFRSTLVKHLLVSVPHPLFAGLSVEFTPTFAERNLSRRAIAEMLAQSEIKPAALHSKGRIVEVNPAASTRGIRIGMPAQDALRLTPFLRLAAVDPNERHQIKTLLTMLLRLSLERLSTESSTFKLFTVSLEQSSRASSNPTGAMLFLVEASSENAVQQLRTLKVALESEAHSVHLPVQTFEPNEAWLQSASYLPIAERTDRIETTLRFLNDTLLDPETYEIALRRAISIARAVASAQNIELEWTIAVQPSQTRSDSAQQALASTWIRMTGASANDQLAADLRRAIGRIATASGGAFLRLVVHSSAESACADSRSALNQRPNPRKPTSRLASEFLQRYGTSRVFQLEHSVADDPEAAYTAVAPSHFGSWDSNAVQAPRPAALPQTVLRVGSDNSAALDEPSFILPKPMPLPQRKGVPYRHGAIRFQSSSQTTLLRNGRRYCRGEDATGDSLWLFQDISTQTWFLAGRFL